MKISLGLVSTAALLTAAGTALAVPRQYRGSDTLEKFTKDLIVNCGATGSYPSLATGEMVYIGGGSGAGASAMAAGTQDIAPMSRSLNANANEACKTSIPAGPAGEGAVNYGTVPGTDAQQWIVALDGLAIPTRAANALRCNADTPDDPSFPNTASLAFNGIKGFPVRAGGIATNPVLSTYTFPDWKDVMRILWAGADKTLAVADGGGAGQTATNRVARCNSDIRRSLISDWDNIIQSPNADCGTVAFSCQNTPNIGSGGIRHLLRRDDLSGTTDTFLTLLGLNAVGGTLAGGDLGVNEPFCNGRDHQDNDPIRLSCTTKNPSPATSTNANGGPAALNANLNDEVCNAGDVGTNVVNGAETALGGVGLVNVVSVPTLISTTGGIPTTANPGGAAGNRREPTIDELYPTQNCIQGAFEFRRPPRQNVYVGTGLRGDPAICPDGLPLAAGNCLTPVFKAGDAELGTSHCINSRSNRPGGALPDGRVWNKFVRAAPGSEFVSATNQDPVLRNERGRDAEMSYFHMRMRMKTQSISNPPNPAQEFAYSADQSCRELDATRAIGCLSRASECSIGYAGRESVDAALPTQASALQVGNVIAANAVGGFADGVTRAEGTKPIGPNDTAVRFLTDTANAANQYRLARKLYINSIVGFPSLLTTRAPTGAEASNPEAFELSQCLTSNSAADKSAVLNAINSAGFLSRIAGCGAVQCEEFNELNCAGTTATSQVLSCDRTPAPTCP